MEAPTDSQLVTEQKHSKKWLFWAAFLMVTVVLLLFLWWLFTRPSRGTISVAPAPEKTDFSAPEHRQSYQGKYFTFNYPSDFNRQEESETVKYPLLERLLLSRSDIEGRKIALMLQDNTGNTFEEYSSFRIRQSEPSIYREENVTRNGLRVVLFTKETSVFEVGAFFGRGNQVMSIVVSSPTTTKGLHEEVLAILDSFQWTAGENSAR
ncbi:MAG: hypothetical protein WAT81_05140 [Candidatus Moraniibacteriota bacterium]